jgi:peptidoglycan-N-acetylglucosamine deacetylase
MTRSVSRRLALGAGGVTTAALAVHLAPAVTSWRWARCHAAPGLSGIGRPEHVALTFDDGPDPASTPAFLDTLERLGWSATFFLLGRQVRRAGSLTQEIVARGHEVGVHGDEHISHLRRPSSWTTRDVLAAKEAISEAAGVVPTWFRPPYGAIAASTLVAAHRAGLRTVLWTCWGKDWRGDATPGSITQSIETARRPGATVLLHDSDVTSAPGSWRAALGSLPVLAERWQAEGLQVGPLGEHGIAART